MTPVTPRGSLDAEHDAGRLDGHVGAGADGDADVGPGQRRGVVHAVADHRHACGPRACSSATARSLSSGSTSANTSSTPSRRRDRLGHRPGVAGDHHDLPHAEGAQVGDGLARPRAAPRPPARARRRPSSPRDEVEHGRAPVAPAGDRRRPGRRAPVEPALAQQRRPADGVPPPSTVASTPRPVSDRKSRRAGDVAALPRRPRRSARASGCSLSASTAAASAQHVVRVEAGAGARSTPVTAWWPLVSVPVLSNSTASTVRIRSSASRSLTRMPAWAAIAVDSATTSGMASPRAWGQAITRTVTVRTTAVVGVAERRPDHERHERPTPAAT